MKLNPTRWEDNSKLGKACDGSELKVDHDHDHEEISETYLCTTALDDLNSQSLINKVQAKNHVHVWEG